jgi:hypothetical protein
MPNHSSGTIAVYLVEKLKPCNPFKFSAYLAGPSLRSKVALYLISYDINEKDAFEYDGLWAKLKSIGATKILYSEWVVVDEVRKANSIYDAVSPVTQLKDRLIVQELTKDASWDKLLISNDEFRKLLQNARG